MSANLRQSFGKTIFCEDIRPEVGGKFSLMGIYESAMYVHVPFPLVLPKFVLWVQCVVPSETMTEDGKLLVHFPGEEKPVIEADVPAEPLIKQRPKEPHVPEDEDDTQRWDIITLPFALAPVVFKQPGRILVRMHIGKVVVKLGTLLIAPVGTQPLAQVTLPLKS